MIHLLIYTHVGVNLLAMSRPAHKSGMPESKGEGKEGKYKNNLSQAEEVNDLQPGDYVTGQKVASMMPLIARMFCKRACVDMSKCPVTLSHSV